MSGRSAVSGRAVCRCSGIARLSTSVRDRSDSGCTSSTTNRMVSPGLIPLPPPARLAEALFEAVNSSSTCTSCPSGLCQRPVRPGINPSREPLSRYRTSLDTDLTVARTSPAGTARGRQHRRARPRRNGTSRFIDRHSSSAGRAHGIAARERCHFPRRDDTPGRPHFPRHSPAHPRDHADPPCPLRCAHDSGYS